MSRLLFFPFFRFSSFHKREGLGFFYNWRCLTTPYSTRGHIKVGDIYILYIIHKTQTDTKFYYIQRHLSMQNSAAAYASTYLNLRNGSTGLSRNDSRSSLYILGTDRTENSPHSSSIFAWRNYRHELSRKHRFPQLLQCCVLPSNGCFSGSTVLALRKYATARLQLHIIFLYRLRER
jgi:hypothetical protein